MIFPVETVPDQSTLIFHHFYWFILAVYFAVYKFDDFLKNDKEADFVVFGGLLAFFSFAFIWPILPVLGSILSLTGLIIVLIGLFHPKWSNLREKRFGRVFWVIALIVLIVSFEDWFSHSFGFHFLDKIYFYLYNQGLVG